MAARHLSFPLNFFSLFGFCRFLLLNELNDLEANSIYQQKPWSLHDFHQPQRCSARFYYVNFRVTKRHAGPFTNPRESVAVIEVSKHGTRTLLQPRKLFLQIALYLWMVNPGPEVSRNDKIQQGISTWHN